MARIASAPAGEKKPVSYRYLATSTQGKLVKGAIKAIGEIDAERLLVDKGLRPITVELVPSLFTLEEALPTLFRIKPREVIMFSRQLATLLKSGVSLLPALETLSTQAASGRAFRRMLRAIVSDLRSGGSFTDALAKHQDAFSELYCKTLAVGEQTGNLETVLSRMADFLEKRGATAQRVRKALSYPLLLLGIGVMVVIILMTVLMPQLMGMFTSLGVKLPLPTRILISTSNFITENPLYIITAVSLVAAIVLWLVKQPRGRRVLDRMLIGAPLIGIPTLLGELARFARTMSVLVSAGLSLQETMELAPQTTTNTVIRDALTQVNERLVMGEGLSEPMSQINLFPPLLVQMVIVGEESNSLGFTMGVVADFYETAAAEKMNSLVGMLEPLSIIGIALIVGFIAISVLMPIYSITGAFG